MDGELLSLKWNNHRSTFLQVVGNLRRQSEQASYADATLACNGKFYPVHRLVLSSCSDYFNSIFDVTSCKNPVIVLKDIERKNLEYLLDYMYIGEVNVRQTELGALVGAAECLKIKGLAVPDDDFSKSESDLSFKNRKTFLHGSLSPQSKRRKLSKNNHNNNHNNNNTEKLNELIHNSEITNHTVNDDTTVGIKCEPVDLEGSHSSNDNSELVNQNSAFASNKVEEDDINSNEQCLVGKEEPVEAEDSCSNIDGNFLYENDNSWKGGEDRLHPDLMDFMSEAVNKASCSSEDPNLEKSIWPPDYLELNSVASTSDQSFDPLSSLQEQFGDALLKSVKGHVSKLRAGFGRERFSSGQHSFAHVGSSNNNKHLLNKLGYRFFCSLCSYASKEKANLKRHMMTHTGEKPFKCPHCDYRSVAHHTIKRHLRTHTGEKPFACLLCDYRCSSSETLKNHGVKHI